MPQSYANYPTDGHLLPEREVIAPNLTARLHGLPESVDLRPWCTPVEDQGQLGACVANAFVSALEYSMIRSGNGAIDLSRMYLYYNGRRLAGRETQRVGLFTHHAMAAIIAYGVCPESAWPYDIENYAVRPPQACYDIASEFDVMQFARVTETPVLKATLAAGIPVSCNMGLPSDWLQIDAARDGKIEAPKGGWPPPPEGSAHNMLVVGYDDRKRAFLFRNSWGADWGRAGHLWIDYDVFEYYAYKRDCWAIGQIALYPQLQITGPSQQEAVIAAQKGAHEDVAAWLAARKRALGGELADTLQRQTAGFRERLRSSTPGAPDPGRLGHARVRSAGPGAGGGYGPEDGPGAGGGYDRKPAGDDGPGAGGGYGQRSLMDDGPGAGGGYDD